MSPRKSRRKSACYSSTSTSTPWRASSRPATIPAGHRRRCNTSSFPFARRADSQRNHGAHPSPCVLAEPIEVYFSIVQRKALSPNDFTDLDLVIDRLNSFEDRYNATARPFKWKFTTNDLANLLDRLDQHQPMQAGNPAQPRAA